MLHLPRSRLRCVLRSKVFRILSRRLPRSEHYHLKIKGRIHYKSITCECSIVEKRFVRVYCFIKPVIIITRMLASLSSVITGVVGCFNRFSKMTSPKKSKSRSTISRVSFDIYNHMHFSRDIVSLRYF